MRIGSYRLRYDGLNGQVLPCLRHVDGTTIHGRPAHWLQSYLEQCGWEIEVLNRHLEPSTWVRRAEYMTWLSDRIKPSAPVEGNNPR